MPRPAETARVPRPLASHQTRKLVTAPPGLSNESPAPTRQTPRDPAKSLMYPLAKMRDTSQEIGSLSARSAAFGSSASYQNGR